MLVCQTKPQIKKEEIITPTRDSRAMIKRNQEETKRNVRIQMQEQNTNTEIEM